MMNAPELRVVVAVGSLFIALFLVACNRSPAAVGASQVVARVNGTDITVLQLNAALARVPNITPQNKAEVSAQVVQELINDEVVLQKAREAKLDRNPAVLQAVEAAKRNILASAWLRQAVSAPEPTDQEIESYFNQHPEYFSQHRVYDYRSVVVKAPAPDVKNIEQWVAERKDMDSLVSKLRAEEAPFLINDFSKGGEQLLPAVLTRFAGIQDGAIVTFPYPDGVEVVQLIRSRLDPVSEEQAKPRIKKYLADTSMKDRVSTTVKSLRDAATIQITGDVQPLEANQPARPATPEPPSSAGDPKSGIGAGIK